MTTPHSSNKAIVLDIDTNRFQIKSTPIEGVQVVKRNPIADDRGFLERLFCVQELEGTAFGGITVQINRTLTLKAGSLRGLHLQHEPHSEAKMISCLSGEIFDVAVDLRPKSKTFGQWHGERLSRENHMSMIIPKGCAHGFQTLVDNCELIYFHSESYMATSEAGVHYADTELEIDWPVEPAEISSRDAQLPTLREYLQENQNEM